MLRRVSTESSSGMEIGESVFTKFILATLAAPIERQWHVDGERKVRRNSLRHGIDSLTQQGH